MAATVHSFMAALEKTAEVEMEGRHEFRQFCGEGGNGNRKYSTKKVNETNDSQKEAMWW